MTTTKCPCDDCPLRKYYARFDIHFYGADCFVECDVYEQWKGMRDDHERTDPVVAPEGD